jgi:hypothetical protein
MMELGFGDENLRDSVRRPMNELGLRTVIATMVSGPDKDSEGISRIQPTDPPGGKTTAENPSILSGIQHEVLAEAA